MSLGPKKLAVNHFLNVRHDPEAALAVVDRCVGEMEVGNYEDVIGLVESPEIVRAMREGSNRKLGRAG
jgi:hypothetical protein